MARCIDCAKLTKEPNLRLTAKNHHKFYQCDSILFEAYIPESSIRKEFVCRYFKKKGECYGN